MASKKGSSKSKSDIAVSSAEETTITETAEERAARKAAKRAAKDAAANGIDIHTSESKSSKSKRKEPSSGESSIINTEVSEVTKPKKHKKESNRDSGSEESTSPSTNSSDVPDEKGNPPLSGMKIRKEIVGALKARGITHAFPIQAKTFDLIVAGRDVVGRAKTGTGKTLAFALPIVERLLSADDKSGKPRMARGRLPRVVVLAPTRELAIQVSNEFESLTDQLTSHCFYGGAPYGPQEAALRKGVDIVVGTCGRIDDLLEKKSLKFDSIQYIIMDEADEMLNMGFAEAVEKILSQVPRTPDREPLQTCLFSATLPSWVESVAKKYLRKDATTRVDLVGESGGKASTNVTHVAIPCHWSERNSVLGECILKYAGLKGRTIIFTETKKDANELVMASEIKQECQALHGDISQAQRETTLQGFREGRFHCLIATDVAARGIDIPGVELVIQIEPPQNVETYIHRSGRTGRANSKGVAITFYTPKQYFWLQQIERKGGVKFQRPGVPQQSDIIEASVRGALQQLSTVHKDVLPQFAKAATELIEQRVSADGDDDKTERTAVEESAERERAATEALAACLAVITGHTQPIKARSLLLSAQDWVTVMVKTNTQIRSLSFIWNIIRKNLWEQPDEKVKGMRMLADSTGAVFDIPCSEEEKVTKLPPQTWFKFSVPTELPQLVAVVAERPPDRPRPWMKDRGSRGGDRGSRGSSRGGGGSSRGRGGGSRGRR